MAKDRFPFPSRSQEESMEERDYSDSKIFHFFRTDLRWEISVHWSCDAGWECGFLIVCLSWWDKKFSRSSVPWAWIMFPVAPVDSWSLFPGIWSRLSPSLVFAMSFCLFVPVCQGLWLSCSTWTDCFWFFSCSATLYWTATCSRPGWECFHPLMWDVLAIRSSSVSRSVTGLAKPLKAAGNNIINET